MRVDRLFILEEFMVGGLNMPGRFLSFQLLDLSTNHLQFLFSSLKKAVPEPNKRVCERGLDQLGTSTSLIVNYSLSLIMSYEFLKGCRLKRPV
jgi:hypothetical protein